jgi:YfiR/HmsC-like
MFRRRDKSIPAIFGRAVVFVMRRPARTITVFLSWSVLFCCHQSAASGQEVVDIRKEYNVKAVTLYAFGRYVTWPESSFETPDSPFVIGVVGENPFGDALDQIAAKKTVGKRPILVRMLTSPSDYARCHILFVPGAVSHEAEAKLFQQVAGKPILLVGESNGFAERGGIINFYQSGANIRFELNPDKASEAQLSFDAKLLSLGTKVTSRK